MGTGVQRANSVSSSVMDPDTDLDLVGSETLTRIRIRIRDRDPDPEKIISELDPGSSVSEMNFK